MATVKMMQGDSYAVFVSLKLKDTEEPITPHMVSEIEITVGESLRKTYTSEEVRYDDEEMQWYFIPTQEETFALEPESYEVQARIKFANGQYSSVKGIVVGNIMIMDASSSEVI
jgi:hypothetical protein